MQLVLEPKIAPDVDLERRKVFAFTPTIRLRYPISDGRKEIAEVYVMGGAGGTLNVLSDSFEKTFKDSDEEIELSPVGFGWNLLAAGGVLMFGDGLGVFAAAGFRHHAVTQDFERAGGEKSDNVYLLSHQEKVISFGLVFFD